MESIAIYARYSSDKQKSESIEQQVQVCSEYCENHGYKVCRVYEDKAMSGRSDDRPSFQKMISDSHMYDAVVVYKFDRFARNRYDSARYKKELKENGCRLESATEQMGDGIESIILESLFEGLSEYYSAQLAQNTSRGMRNNASKCKVNGMLPYGYSNVDGRYEVVEHEAEVVRKVFRLYAENRHFDVDEEFGNVVTRRGKKFTRSMLSQMVRNERYRGVYMWGDVRVEDGIPRIVSEDLWNAAQARLGKRRRRTMKKRMALTGKLFGKSGNPSQTQGTKTKYGEYQYYVVDGEYIERGELESMVASSIRESLSGDDTVSKIVDIVLEAQENQTEGSAICEELEECISSVSKEKANYIAAIGKMGLNDALVDAVNDCDKRIAGYEKELDKERKRIEAIHLDEMKIRILTERMSECMDDDKLIDTWVSYVIVFEEHLSIYCNWDRHPATDASIAAAITSDDGVRVCSSWCPRYELSRTTCTKEALVVLVRR